MSIGDRIMKLRKEAGLSQEAFAEKLGVSRQSVSKWETNSATPDLNKAIAICELFGVSSDYLLYGKEVSPEPETNAEETIEEPEEKSYEEVYIGEEYTEEDYINEVYPEEVFEEENEKEKKAKLLHNKKSRIIAAVLSCCILLGAILPISIAGFKKLRAKSNNGQNVSSAENPAVQPSDSHNYPYVLVHGMGGWGEGAAINSVSPYWGSSTGSLSEYLRGEGHQIYEVNVGPFSSAWDRACELYAQLTGTTVDYGAAHSKAHGHNRYGKEYTVPLYTEWGKETDSSQIKKINLVGHSFGGTTIRLLASLMEYGSEAEQKASPNDLSPLFKGGKGEWINSITTLCSPHNGSTLYYIADQESLIPTALNVLQFADGLADKVDSGMLDLQLEHFGITSDAQDKLSLVHKNFSTGKDNAFYDLSPHGAKELNQSIKTVDSVYYFSYAYCTTEKSKISDNQVPVSSTYPLLMLTAKFIGSYTNTSNDAPVKIDESWLPNDGLVNVVSAKYPSGEKYIDYTEGMQINKGIWHVFQTKEGHHGTVIGMDGDAQQTHDFYTNLITLINALQK